MNDAEKNKLKLAISSRMGELAATLDARSEQDRDKASYEGKPEQLASPDTDEEVAAMNKLELQALGRSLEWLDSDDGGYCELCGCEIQAKRLLALPSVRSCIDCARKKEL